ncbi:AMP deaminase [Schizopora paradoxa]|uniref:AMP deaminase n=1 Tax=Schizopora paradoxa TaxID=27342 RepID=A0A0H2SCT4_9AGAM|nr:AMP deaminase [Schizopora paradoxa]
MDSDSSREPSPQRSNDSQSSLESPVHVAGTTHESTNSFFPYNEEKTLQHIEEKLFAHRRLSNANDGIKPSGLSLHLAAAEQHGGDSALSISPPNIRASPLLTARKATPQPQPMCNLHLDHEESEVLAENHVPAVNYGALPAELQALYQSLQKCLDLRDKYMRLSKQRLGDNPRDRDDVFTDIDEELQGVNGIRPDANFSNHVKKTEKVQPTPKNERPWKIYPKPPPPHWHWKAKKSSISGENGLNGIPESIEKSEIDEEDFDLDQCEIPGADEEQRWFKLDERGVYQVYEGPEDESTSKSPIYEVPSIREYYVDLDYVLSVISDGPTKSFAFRRLKYLASKWSMYSLVNEYRETADMKKVPHRDFYNVRKVDTHVHHSSSMNQKHLLRFIKSKMKRFPEDVVIFRDNHQLTLAQVFESLNLTAYDLSIDTLDMHAHQDSFHRFDKFNLKYNPIGESRLREIFLKTDNFIKGRYLAELTKEVMTDLEQSKYQNCEWRISIYGRAVNEWDKLAKWVVDNKLFSHNIRWLIQMPRLYDVYKANGTVETFEDVLKNIFQPLFEVTQNPETHPELHIFLQRVIGFDSVDDESKSERRIHKKFPYPRLWDSKQSPPYSYWIYYMFANLTSLNNWRQSRGFNTFVLRPHCGEAGDPDHLTSAYLTSHSISHGILLRKVPALQYLFYLKQIGIAMSPLSNNSLFLTYERNPFPDFFKVGLNVSLSTDDPLQFHFTKEPLLEEYSVAAHIYKFPQSSLAELARNSVIQSGFEMEIKRHWLGQKWYLPGAAGNDINKTNVPDIRLAFRHETLLEELRIIRDNQSVLPSAVSGASQVKGGAPSIGSSDPASDTIAASAMSLAAKN